MGMICFGILVLSILFIRKVFWKRISRVTQYSLWLFAAFFLLFRPVLGIASRFSIENIIYDAAGRFAYSENTEVTLADALYSGMINNIFEAYDFGAEVSGEAAVSDAAEPLPDNGESSAGKKETDISLIQRNGVKNEFADCGKEKERTALKYWYVVRDGISALLLFLVVTSNVRFYRFCHKNRSLYRKADRFPLNIYRLEGIASPFLFGRNIYVDTDMIKDEKILRHIVLHEYCHYKHGDNFWILIRNLCLILNWYNPFVWLAVAYVKRDCELACDEAVLKYLDEGAYSEYGYTLISLLKCANRQKRHPAAVATTMRGNMKKMKERIVMIKTSHRYHVQVAWAVILSMIVLTGCTFTQRKPQEEPALSDTDIADSHEAEEISVVEETAEIDEEEEYFNTYYNVSAKYYDGCTYVEGEDALYRIEDEGEDFEIVHKGKVTLGTIAGGYLFFYQYPENMEEAAIMSLDLASGEVKEALLGGTDIISYREMYGEDDKLYIARSMKAEVSVYRIKADGTLENYDSLPVSVPQDFTQEGMEVFPISAVISRGEGYSGNFYIGKEKGEYPHRLFAYEGDSLIRTVEGLTDLMITSKGIIGRDVSHYNDVYLYDMSTDTKRLLYAASENEDKYFGCNTYNEYGIYGLRKESDASYTVSRLGWDGSVETLFPLEGIERGVDVKMSVIDSFIYYYNPLNDKMERRDLANVQKAEIIG